MLLLKKASTHLFGFSLFSLFILVVILWYKQKQQKNNAHPQVQQQECSIFLHELCISKNLLMIMIIISICQGGTNGIELYIFFSVYQKVVLETIIEIFNLQKLCILS